MLYLYLTNVLKNGSILLLNGLSFPLKFVIIKRSDKCVPERKEPEVYEGD